MERQPIEFEIPEIEGSESKLLIANLIKTYRQKEESKDKNSNKKQVNNVLSSEDLINYYKIDLNDGMNMYGERIREKSVQEDSVQDPINL